MKKQLFLAGFSTLILFSACKKNTPGYTESDYSFDAGLAVSSITAGDSAKFTLTDNPDVISFYSGELGSVHEYRNRTVLTGGSLRMKFETRTINKVADTLEVLISNNFSGVYDSANVANASWKKMTNKFLFPVASTVLGTFIPSGPTSSDFTNITDSVVAGQPFYLAFRYDITKQNNIEWSVGKLGMYNIFSNGLANATVIDSNTNNSGNFAAVRFGEPVSKWTKTSTLYKCLNTSTAVIGAQHWYISRPLNPNAVTPDVPSIIKNISQSPLTSFKYKYSTPGTYKAVFVASYNRLNFEKTFVKEFTVVVR